MTSSHELNDTIRRLISPDAIKSDCIAPIPSPKQRGILWNIKKHKPAALLRCNSEAMPQNRFFTTEETPVSQYKRSLKVDNYERQKTVQHAKRSVEIETMKKQ